MSLQQSEVFILTLEDLNKMKTEFNEMYDLVFKDSNVILQNALMLKFRAHSDC